MQKIIYDRVSPCLENWGIGIELIYFKDDRLICSLKGASLEEVLINYFNERKIEIFDAHFRRNYIHVKDICKAFYHGIFQWWRGGKKLTGNVYNLGNDEINCTKKQLAETISTTLNTQYIINENKTDLMIKLMIMAAVYEFMFMHKTPIKVIISEYVKVANFFVKESQKSFNSFKISIISDITVDPGKEKEVLSSD